MSETIIQLIDRNDLLVTAVCRLRFPSSIVSNTSSGLLTNRSEHPFTYGT
jgi:hypothetical protein